MKATTLPVLVILAIVLSVSACAGLWGPEGRRGVSSSLVDYLYPKGEIPPKHDQTIPYLEIPLTVGLAFVPGSGSDAGSLPEAHKAQLLQKVKAAFQDRDFIAQISIIPETYMRSTRGFEGVDQVARLYGLDVVALVSYDQVATASEKKSSLLYWTIVGAYVIKGTENEASTFVDTAVFDVRSRKLLFRAPGVSETRKSTTLIEVEETYRETRKKGFELAMADMTRNLEVEMDAFRERIKQDKSVEVATRPGYVGGGAMAPWLLAMLLGGAVFYGRSGATRQRRAR